MTPRASLLVALCCLTACAKLAPGGAGLGDPCTVTSDCADPYVCADGRCTVDTARVCEASSLQCNGNTVEQCTTAGDAWTVLQVCALGCVQGACQQPVCTANVQRCAGNEIQECLPDGSAWTDLTECPTACVQSTTTATMSECTAPVCTPFETQCNATSPAVIQTCTFNGTSWTAAPCSTDPTMPATCVNGECLPVVCTTTVTGGTDGGTTVSQQRCNGDVAEQCNATGTAYVTQPNGVCPNGCDYDPTTGLASCPAQVCTPFTTLCAADGVTLQTCNARGTAYTSATCSVATGQAACVGNTCLPVVCTTTTDGSGNVTSRQQECSGNVQNQCNDTGTAWEPVQICQYGCVSTSPGVAACGEPACAVGQQACDGEVLEECSPDQSTYGFVQYCPSGCTANTSTVPPTASCAPPVCPPLNRQCGTDPTTMGADVMVCSADGTGYTEIETCAQTCVAGTCVETPGSCVAGSIQCFGDEVQECVTLSNGSAGGADGGTPATTAWQFVEHCLGICSSGACGPGGACGCATGSTTGACGSATNQPITVNVLVPASALPIPCGDGVSLSRVVVYTSPITDINGITVPDGTMVTFANDSPAGSPDNLIMSPDADPTTPGLQRPTLNGVADVLLAAPAASNCGSGTRTVTVTALVAGSCEGTLAIPFAALPTTSSRTVYIAEDFSTTVDEDRSFTTAQWNTNNGSAAAIPSYSLGTGVDGNLNVEPGVPLDLQASGYAPAWNVLGFTTQGAALDNASPLSLIPGDEVLLATIWGPAGSTGPGSYEFKHVVTVTFGNVTFDAPIVQQFGNGTNTDLTGHRVIMQKVPQFENVNVPYNATLTVSGMNTGTCMTAASCTPVGGTGILAFRARGTLSISGDVSADNLGLPLFLTSYPTTASTPSLNRLLPGLPGSTSGGGIIFITAGTVSFVNPTPTEVPTIHANSSAGGGGTVWVASGYLQFGGAPRVVAQGAAGTGRARLDYSSIDNTTTPMAAGASMFVGQAGASVARSLTMYLEPTLMTTSFAVQQAQLFGIIGGSAVTTVALPPPANGLTQLIPGINISLTADGGATFAAIDSGSANFVVQPPPGTASAGRDVRFSASLAPPDDKVLSLRAVGFSVLAH